MKSLPVLGTTLSLTTYAGLGDFLLAELARGGVRAVDFANTHVITLRRHDAGFRKLGGAMDWVVPDGMPLVWVLNRRGARLTDRVYGPTFTREFLSKAPATTTHYLVGGSLECGEAFRARMLAANPGLQFVGGYHGLCDMEGVLEEDAAVLAELKEKQPDFIWVGLGAPKQYAWIARVKPLLTRGIFLAVGFAFDVNAGTKSDAPLWMQKRGLTWLYRLGKEPRRLAGRYFKWNSLFLWYLALEALSGKKVGR